MKSITLPSGRHVTVQVHHLRRVVTDADDIVRLNVLGEPEFERYGTTAEINVAEGLSLEKVGLGIALVHPGDAFKKHTGTSLALARAMQSAGLTKPERTVLWSRVWNGKYDKKGTV